jgi:hypothetical protein
MTYLEAISDLSGEFQMEAMYLRDNVNSIKKIKEEEQSMDIVREVLKVEKKLNSTISYVIGSKNFGDVARKMFAELAMGNELELQGVGKVGPIKIKWKRAKAKKNNLGMSQDQQKVFQDADKAEVKESSKGSSQNETQIEKGNYLY